MTLKEIYDYIGPLLGDDEIATQDASLIIHCADGSVEVVKKDDDGDRRPTTPPLELGSERPNP